MRFSDCVSSILNINAGATQGTLAGPDNFRVMINDLTFSLPYVKYVDDVSACSVSHDVLDNSLQEAVDDLLSWCKHNSMVLNPLKTKEMVIHFSRRHTTSEAPLIVVDNKHIERVKSFKLLGVFLSSDLSWSEHVNYIVSKASKRMFVLFQLIKSGVKLADIVVVYCSIIRSILEYACPVWHCGLSKAQADEIESVQRRCMRALLPDISYDEALVIFGLERLDVRRERIVRDLFNEVKCEGHVLNHLLLRRNTELSKVDTRNKYPYLMKLGKTNRLNRSFIYYCIKKKY